MWVETSKEVYAVIMAKHRKDMCVHSSFTDSTGNGYEFSSGKPTIHTEWGFKDSDYPLLRVEDEKENEQQKDWETKFFIFYAQ